MLNRRLLSMACAALLATLFVSTVSQAQIDAFNTIVNNGSSGNRVDMIFIGDGYQASEVNSTYVTHIQSTLDHFFSTAPLARYNRFFNVHRVNVVSNQSGADRPLDNYYVDTALDASYSWQGNVERCLYFNTTKANNAVAAALAGTGIDTNDGMLLGTVNDSKYGGCGGQWGVYAGANSAAQEIALHEIGHSFANLADEYFYTSDDYNGPEPNAWNVTANPGSGKWDRWVGYNDPDSDIGPIGYYEGGMYNATGIWRPSDNSKMRALNRPFDAVGREKFINDIYQEVRPLDDWLVLSESVLENPSTLWVDTVDADVINVEWFVDGLSRGILGEEVFLSALGLSRGDHIITARAYDSILDHAFTGGSLDWWRLSPDLLQQSVSWNIFVAVPEPSTALFSGLFGVVCLIGRRRRV
jgi:hypothetical protein